MVVPQMAAIADRVNNPPKFVQCLQMCNEAEFVPIVLSSIYDQVDRIVVIEGAVENRPNSTPDGHSTDNTIELIDKFIAEHDEEKKITFYKIKRPWRNLEEIKQSFLDMATDGEWLIINDADEIYQPDDIIRLRQAIDLNPYACEFVPLFLHFYKDFQHIAAPAADWQPQHQRVFQKQRGMKYNSHPIVTDGEGKCTYFTPEYQARRVMLNRFYVFHYGYARTNMKGVMEAKTEYYQKELKQLGQASQEFERKSNEFLNYTEGSDRILTIPLDMHPEVMKAHPMFNHVDEKLKEKEFGRWVDHPLYKADCCNQPYGNIYLCMNGMAEPYMDMYHNGMVL